ncbi:MAG: hypothetical protein CVT92_13915 [Bacteroidetes bacterium HGW-Bacteroidetes-1]|jgi:hypothetical protein|nr:MAG: hypothetical protein CVT92_13915 [Bacteroidetes bacterium HGW-Bacteroidetes-1]
MHKFTKANNMKTFVISILTIIMFLQVQKVEAQSVAGNDPHWELVWQDEFNSGYFQPDAYKWTVKDNWDQWAYQSRFNPFCSYPDIRL